MASGAYPLVKPGRLLIQQPIATRDGTAVLAADVWLPPATPHGDGPWPALLCRSRVCRRRMAFLNWRQRAESCGKGACTSTAARERTSEP